MSQHLEHFTVSQLAMWWLRISWPTSHLFSLAPEFLTLGQIWDKFETNFGENIWWNLYMKIILQILFSNGKYN